MRLQLSVVFITIYVSIILSRDSIFGRSNLNTGYFATLLYTILIFGGIIITGSFFLYLMFIALELNFHKKKEIVFEQEISAEKITKLKRFFYNLGVSNIFLSIFGFPIYFLFTIISSGFDKVVAFIIWFFCLALVYILYFVVFSDTVIGKSKASKHNKPFRKNTCEE